MMSASLMTRVFMRAAGDSVVEEIAVELAGDAVNEDAEREVAEIPVVQL